MLHECCLFYCSWLPICTVIDKKILVCHGGISNKTNLAEIDKLDRHQYMSVLNPPQDESLPEGHPDKINFKEWRQILDTLWSDPKPQNGCEPNTFRGGGCYFGPDICNLASFKLYTNDKPDFLIYEVCEITL